jgi:hypothetical protein
MTTTTEPTSDVAPDLMEQLDIPQSSPQRGRARTPEPAAGDATDDIVTADQRIKKFRTKYPDGVIATSVESDAQGTFTARAEVWKTSPTTGVGGARYTRHPDATATATRSRDDEPSVGSLYPQESAETAAIGRALRFLGIEPPKPRKKSAD